MKKTLVISPGFFALISAFVAGDSYSQCNSQGPSSWDVTVANQQCTVDTLPEYVDRLSLFPYVLGADGVGALLTVNVSEFMIQGGGRDSVVASNFGKVIYNGALNISEVVAPYSGLKTDTSGVIEINGSLNIASGGLGVVVGTGTVEINGALEISVGNLGVSSAVGACNTLAAICLIGNDSIFDGRNISNGSIKSDGYAIQVEAGSRVLVQIANTTIANSNNTDALIEVNSNNGNASSGATLLKFWNSSLKAGNHSQGILINGSTFSNVDLYADATQMYGKAMTGTDSVVNIHLSNNSYYFGWTDGVNIDIDSSSTWQVMYDSTAYNVENNGTLKFINAYGAVDGPKTLKVDSYTGQGGSLSINTYLDGNGAAVSDRLVIEKFTIGNGLSSNSGFVANGAASGSAQGATSIYVLDRGGLGMPTTGKGIQVVEATPGTTTDVNAFNLGATVSAGAYEYNLYRNADQSWYLTTNQIPSTDTPNYSDEAYAVSILPSLAQIYGAATLSSWRDRVGVQTFENNMNSTVSGQSRSPLWVRMATAHGHQNGGQRFTPTSTSSGYTPNYKYKTSFMQLGAELFSGPAYGNGLQTAGVFLTIGHIHGDVRSYQEVDGQLQAAVSSAKLDNKALGAYWTFMGEQSNYVDIVGQYIRHDLSTKATSDTLKGRGHSWMAALEVGQAYAWSPKLTLVPQAQLRWQNVNFGRNGALASGDTVGQYTFASNDALQTRVGVEARWQAFNQGRAWVRLDVLHEFKGKNRTRYESATALTNSPDFTSSRQGTSVDVNAGLDVILRDGVSLYGSTGYQRGVSRHTKGHAWNVSFGVRWGF